MKRNTLPLIRFCLSTCTSAALAWSGSSGIVAAEGGTIQDLSVLACTVDDELEFFPFFRAGQQMLGTDAVVSTVGDVTTAVLGETVYQFRGETLQILSRGELATTSCTDVTDQFVAALGMLEGIEIPSAGRIESLERQNRILKARLAEMSARWETPSPTSGVPMTGPEREDFRTHVQRCWNVDPGGEAAEVTVTVIFDLDRSGRVEGDIRRISASGGSEAAVDEAFMAARRAILRCQADGFPVPTGKWEQWRTVEMTFDPTGLRLR